MKVELNRISISSEEEKEILKLISQYELNAD
jgi:hypothetical protein